MEPASTHFNVLILRTHLSHSIAAAALAKAGLSVLHVDEAEFYGADDAALTPVDLATLQSVSCTPSDPPAHARQYSIQLAPALVSATGPLISAVVASGVSKYGAYKLLDALALAAPPPDGVLRAVPGSKEDVFRAADMSLLDKRRLMKFLLFVASDADVDAIDESFSQYVRREFGLPDALVDAVVFALAQCTVADEPTNTALARVRTFIRSSGRYGNSPFLVAHYGGLGEIAQGFCRTAAVHGAVYILGRRILSLSRSEDKKWRIELDGVPDILTADVLVAEDDATVAHRTTSLVAITDRPVRVEPSASPEEDGPQSQQQAPDDALIIFPPAPDTGLPHVVRALVNGARSMSAPPGHWVLHLSTTGVDDPSALRQCLNRILQPDVEPIWTCSFVHPPSTSLPPAASGAEVRIPHCSGGPTTLGDVAAETAERAFFDIVKLVKGEQAIEDGEIGWFLQTEDELGPKGDDEEDW